MEQFDLSQNTKLERLECGSNHLASLDLSKNTGLRMLFCSDNQLTSLDVSKNTQLKYLYCSGNQIEYAEMEKLVASLPLFTPATPGDEAQFQVFDYSVDDHNTISVAQVNTAKAKGWRCVVFIQRRHAGLRRLQRHSNQRRNLP